MTKYLTISPVIYKWSPMNKYSHYTFQIKVFDNQTLATPIKPGDMVLLQG